MKQFYSSRVDLRSAKTGLLSAFFLFAFFLAGGQTYYTTLSGPNEAPPNASPGTGKALLTIAGNNMSLQTSFSGLLGNTTAAHIHAPTALPLTGTASVATQVPYFVGFPIGVTAGTYAQTFDLSLASTYNPAYVTSNGGLVSNASNALKAAIADGKAYLNIHTTVVPAGEIRGFFTLCPTITVTIPDALALPKGVQPNTVYPAYSPAASLMLSAMASGGAGSYTYNWSTSATSQGITVSPTATTMYSVTVRDANGCPGSASKTVQVMDISSGKNDNKITICHKGNNTQSIAAPAVAAHLDHGDMLGGCSGAGKSITVKNGETAQMTEDVSVSVRSNPSASHFELQLRGQAGSNVQVRVLDLMGRLVETKNAVPSNQLLRVGTSYGPGVYLLQVVQGAKVQTLRLVKTR